MTNLGPGEKRKLYEALNCDDNEATGISECMTTELGKEPSESEMQALFANLSCGNATPVILSLIPQYLGTFPQPLKSLQKPEVCQFELS